MFTYRHAVLHFFIKAKMWDNTYTWMGLPGYHSSPNIQYMTRLSGMGGKLSPMAMDCLHA